jgi:rhodanese-related sulfurtransferase
MRAKQKMMAAAVSAAVAFVLTADVRRGGGRAFGGDASAASAAKAQPTPFEFIEAEALKARIAAGETITIIDVRPSRYQDEDRIKGALRIRLRRLKDRMAFYPLRDLPREREVVTYCACPADEAGLRAAEIFRQAGFKRVRILKGGWDAWRMARGPVQQGPGI